MLHYYLTEEVGQILIIHDELIARTLKDSYSFINQLNEAIFLTNNVLSSDH